MGRLTQLPARVGGIGPRVRSMPKEAERFYASEGWKAYRSAHRAWTKARLGGVWCCVCGAARRLILDHVIERKDGGPDFPPYEGAKWYCTGCHNTKTSKARASRASGAV
jgi:5-methylcytosine-specific restriction enzyme A